MARIPCRPSFVLVTLLLTSCTTQSPRPGDGELTCIDCTVMLERAGVVSDAHEPGVISERMPTLAHDSRGRTFVATRERDAVLVFDSTGVLLKRLGQFGEGPGEFRSVRRILVGAHDTVHVTDWGTNRVIVYGPELNREGTHPLEKQPELIMRDGRYIAAGDPGFTSSRPTSFMLLSGTGDVIRTVAADTAIDGTPVLLDRRIVAESGEGGVWTAGRGVYRLDRWDASSGKRVASIDVASEWAGEFGAWDGDLGVRPPAGIVSLWEAGGLVWVLLRVADRAWTPRDDGGGERLIEAEEYDTMHDWVIEVIDPVHGEVVASRRFERALWGSASSPYLASRGEPVTDDLLEFDVWRPRLVPRGVR